MSGNPVECSDEFVTRSVFEHAPAPTPAPAPAAQAAKIASAPTQIPLDRAERLAGPREYALRAVIAALDDNARPVSTAELRSVRALTCKIAATFLEPGLFRFWILVLELLSMVHPLEVPYVLMLILVYVARDTTAPLRAIGAIGVLFAVHILLWRATMFCIWAASALLLN